MKIRDANKEDIDELITLLSYLFAKEADFSFNEKLQKKGLKKIIKDPKKAQIFVAMKKGKIVGMVNLLFTISTALGAKVAILEDMIVTPEYRDKKVGTKLIKHVLNFAKTDKIKRISLLSDGDNLRAHAFYNKFGFKKSQMILFRR